MLQQVKFKYNLHIGSCDSLDFHMALSNVKDVTVFNSETLQLIIKYKWEKLSWIVQCQSLIFFSYLIAIMVHANDHENATTIYPLIAYLVYFVSMEVIAVKVDYKSSYFKDVWNLLDFTFIGLLALYIITWFRSESMEKNIKFLAIVNLVSWIRGLSQLRCF